MQAASQRQGKDEGPWKGALSQGPPSEPCLPKASRPGPQDLVSPPTALPSAPAHMPAPPLGFLFPSAVRVLQEAACSRWGCCACKSDHLAQDRFPTCLKAVHAALEAAGETKAREEANQSWGGGWGALADTSFLSPSSVSPEFKGC